MGMSLPSIFNLAPWEVVPFPLSYLDTFKENIEYMSCEVLLLCMQFKGEITLAVLHFEQSQSFLDQAVGTCAHCKTLFNKIHQK